MSLMRSEIIKYDAAIIYRKKPLILMAKKMNLYLAEDVSFVMYGEIILKILDGSKMYFDEMIFYTSKLTVIGIETFSDIERKEDYNDIGIEGLTRFGISQKLSGKFSKVIKMNSLSRDDLKKILLESDLSPLNTYTSFFDEMGISFSYDERFVDFIAEKVEKLNIGARGLKTTFDEQISGALFNAFSGDYDCISLVSPDENGIAYELHQIKTKKLFKRKNKK